MYALSNFYKKFKKLVFIITFLSILVLLPISPAVASVNDWEFSPKEPVSGDTLNIKGSASPGEKVDLFVSFGKTVSVSGGKFEYILEDVKIPRGLNNAFTVEAIGAEKLNVRVKMGIWVTKSSEASGDAAIVSQSSVPSGTYRIKIDGSAKEGVSNVKLKITAFQKIEAGSNGEFSYAYNTKAMPAGDFEIKVGGITKVVTIKEKEDSGSMSDSSSTDSSSKDSTSADPSSADSSSEDSASAGSSTNSDSMSSSTKSSTEGSSSKLSATETESSVKPISSETIEENEVSHASISDENSGEGSNQTQLSGKDTKTSESSGISTDKFYLLAGIGVGLLILIIYSRRK